MSRYSHISVAIPMMAELENVPALIRAFEKQTYRQYTVYCCVNNPEGWESSETEWEQKTFLDNQQTLRQLQTYQRQCTIDLQILDHSSTGRGWTGKRKGVGWARKELFDTISRQRDDNELIVSLDADTAISETYLESVLSAMNGHSQHSALCVPYYHPTTGNENNDRAMLRYEIYMRHYLINLLELDNPYAFTALGSAMVFPLWAYRRVGGITPLQGGEDFYLMQKYAKTGRLLHTCNEEVRPQGRPSKRVPFGTGPAIAKGIDSMDITYPLYPQEGFQAVADTYALFPTLYDKDIETPMSSFLRQQLKEDDLWSPLRKNFKTRELFVHACQERVDGLRILQYLKTYPPRPAEEELRQFCRRHEISIPEGFDFRTTPIETINTLRDSLYHCEQLWRQHQA